MPRSLIDGFVGDRRLTLGEEVEASDPLVKERPELFEGDEKRPARRAKGE